MLPEHLDEVRVPVAEHAGPAQGVGIPGDPEVSGRPGQGGLSGLGVQTVDVPVLVEPLRVGRGLGQDPLP